MWDKKVITLQSMIGEAEGEAHNDQDLTVGA